MRRIGLSTVPATLCLLAALLTGCANTPKDVTQGWSNERLYQEARDEVSAGAWDKAIGFLDKLEGRAAGTVLAQQAQIDKAYAQYRNNDKVPAIATLDRFMRLHPTSPAMDYALYLKGLINFNDNLGLFSALINQDLSERDQKAAKESYEAFQDLVTRFPESKYSPEARQRMLSIQSRTVRENAEADLARLVGLQIVGMDGRRLVGNHIAEQTDRQAGLVRLG